MFVAYVKLNGNTLKNKLINNMNNMNKDLINIGFSLIMTGGCILPNIDFFMRYKKYWNGEKILIYKIIETTGAVLIISSLYL